MEYFGCIYNTVQISPQYTRIVQILASSGIVFNAICIIKGWYYDRNSLRKHYEMIGNL